LGLQDALRKLRYPDEGLKRPGAWSGLNGVEVADKFSFVKREAILTPRFSDNVIASSNEGSC